MSHVIVTGGASGIGAATAALLTDRGAHVSVLDKVTPTSDSGSITYTGCDVSNWEEVARAVADAVAQSGPVNAAVLCAGIDPTREPLERLDPGLWAEILGVNLTGAFHLSRAVTPNLVDGGAVAICGSVLGSVAIEGVSAYAASKSGLHGLMRVWALELANRRIRVNCIEPAAVRTPMLEATLTDRLGEDADLSVYGDERRVGKPMEAMDIARVLAWMVGPESAPISGAIIPVDTGLTSWAGI